MWFLVLRTRAESNRTRQEGGRWLQEFGHCTLTEVHDQGRWDQEAVVGPTGADNLGHETQVFPTKRCQSWSGCGDKEKAKRFFVLLAGYRPESTQDLVMSSLGLNRNGSTTCSRCGGGRWMSSDPKKDVVGEGCLVSWTNRSPTGSLGYG